MNGHAVGRVFSPRFMIYTKLVGGLGNQMFQYATGRAVALRLQSSLALDTSYFPGIDNRHYELGIFHVAARVLGPLEEKLLWFRSRRRTRRLRLLIAPFVSGQSLQVIENHGHNFDPRLADVSGDVFLHGLWHSPAYFEKINDTLRLDFTFRELPDETNRRLITQIEDTTSVALHVRRGDYLVGQENIGRFGTCSLTYYREGIRRMRERFGSPHFFVFSDDPKWARQNLPIDDPVTFITHNLASHQHEDLRLMSHCRHFIIANSTFSWWGAWLGRDPQKHVIAPQRWFRHKAVPELFPPTWNRLDL